MVNMQELGKPVLTIGDAIRGEGIALGSVALLRAELDSGRLVRLCKDVLRTNRGYYLCHDGQSTLSGDARCLTDFLRAQAKLERGFLE